MFLIISEVRIYPGYLNKDFLSFYQGYGAIIDHQ